MTDVFEVIGTDFNIEKLADELFASFKQKETNEIDRISQMIAFFESSDCISLKLAHYFGDQRQTKPCGHCSVCERNGEGNGLSATLPCDLHLSPLTDLNSHKLCRAVRAASDEPLSHDMLTRFLCGISNPLFTRLKARSIPGFGGLEQYHYQDVKSWLASMS